MSRVVVISILIVALLFAAVWLAGLPDSEGDTDPVVQQPQQSPADTAYQNGADEPVGVVATDAENEIDASACDFRQLRTLQQFNRENLQRLEPSILSPETVSSYRGLSVHDLEALVEQEDSVAMMITGVHLLLASMGRNPELAVDYLAHQIPINEIASSPEGVPKNAHLYASMARDMFFEAALHGRHAAFPFVGLTYEAQGKDAIDLEWISQEAYDSLDDDQKHSLKPSVAFSQLAYVIDPNLLPAGSPDRKLFDDSLDRLGENAKFLDELESEFRQRLKRHGKSFPTLPPLTYPDVDEEVIATCEEAGYSQWPG